MEITLKDLLNIILANVDAETAKICIEKYFKLHKSVNPNKVLEFNVPTCFNTEEEQKSFISRFYAISVRGEPLGYLQTFAETKIFEIAKSFNRIMDELEKYTIQEPELDIGIMSNRLSFATGDSGLLIVSTDNEKLLDGFYCGKNHLVFIIKDTRNKQDIVLKKCNFYEFPMDKIDGIHKILTIYDYSLKQTKKPTVNPTEDSVYQFIVKAFEDFLNGQDNAYGYYKVFSDEKFELLNKMIIASLDKQIIHKAYTSAEKAAQQINEAQTTATSQANG